MPVERGHGGGSGGADEDAGYWDVKDGGYLEERGDGWGKEEETGITIS